MVKKSIKDAYGTSIRSYLKAFGGYDTSLIEANVNAIAATDLNYKKGILFLSKEYPFYFFSYFASQSSSILH
jgi:hypothetical protein